MVGHHSEGTHRAGLPCQPPWAALQAVPLLLSSLHRVSSATKK